MALKKSTGNMYSWVTHCWNPIRGKCGHDCPYCYAKRWGTLKPLHLDEKDLKTHLGNGNTIFVCSGCDLFEYNVPDEWIKAVVDHAREFSFNTYLWHTKNPSRVVGKLWPGRFEFPEQSILCVTLETNRPGPAEFMGHAPSRRDRRFALGYWEGRKMITMEPVMDFDIFEMAEMMRGIEQVNIGADSGRNGLPEPSRKKLEDFLDLVELKSPGTRVHLKKNLRRLLPEHRLYGREYA